MSLSPTLAPNEITTLTSRLRSLLLLHEVTQRPPLRQALRVLATALDPEQSADAGAIGEAYGALFRAVLVTSSSAFTAGLAADLLYEENALSRWVEANGRELPPAMQRAVALDLRALQALAQAVERLPELAGQALGLGEPLPWPSAPITSTTSTTTTTAATAATAASAVSSGITATAATAASAVSSGITATAATFPSAAPREGSGDANEFGLRLAQATDWATLAPMLVEHYAEHGSGYLARYRSFRWVGDEGSESAENGAQTPGAPEGLLPVPQPDSVHTSRLIGYQAERELLRTNTAQFLAGFAANNMLLYGDRGTGKSSSVKALLNETARTTEEAAAVPWPRLRLVEVPKARLGDFPVIVARLRHRPQKFILFVDDLSFEEGETHYKDLKALLEGGVEARPANVVIYATSNRRHLVRELFSDRTSPASEDVHARDTVQEKLSFSDRFGLSITFPTPDQAAYLAMVEGLADQRGLVLDPAVLRARAIEWAAWHNGRSGRTARQFIDYLAGELGLAALTSGLRTTGTDVSARV